MENNSQKQQMRILLLRNFLAFTLIFIVLGLVIFQLLQQSLYRNTDHELIRVSHDQRLLEQELITTLQIENRNNDERDPAFRPRQPELFNTQLLIWSKNGKKILNKDHLGNRYYEFKELNLNKKRLEQVKNDHLKVATTTLYFRSITKKIRYQNQTYYIEYIVNTNQLHETMRSVQVLLLLSLVFFWALSLGASYWLAKRSMAPILLSWQKQQEFVENASHELRTPLTIIQSQLELLFTTPQKTILDVSEKIGTALAEVKRLTRLTTDLLLLAKTDSHDFVLKIEKVAVKDFVNETVSPYQELIETSKRNFHLENQAACFVNIDREKIKQVLIILLDNALKYTEEGATITVSSSLQGYDWCLQVQDTGKGISPEDRERIFERFYRVEKSRNRKVGGYGLGLAIAAQIVKFHHGKITVFDNFPQGSVFEIRIPKEN